MTEPGLVAEPGRRVGVARQTEKANPLGADFDYAEEFKKLDVEALKRDLIEMMTTSQDWWPADYGHYGGLFIRMSWHAAGTYRIADGRGGGGQGAQRFAPLNSWPDNANLDKARRLLWPVKQKYGNKISWADLLVLAGNVALESMGFKTAGFAFGREDTWEPEETLWGFEDTWLGTDKRYSGERELANPFGATTMGLIYVNPEGPEGEPGSDQGGLRHSRDVRPDGDERRGNRRADRRWPHLRQDSWRRRRRSGGPGARGRPDRTAGPGLEELLRQRQGRRPVTSGLEVVWTPTPTKWDNSFLETLYGNEWELTQSPAGAWQYVAKDAEEIIPDPFDSSKKRKPTMLVTDVSMRVSPIYADITRRWLDHPEELADAFAKAWFKLLHRDMGPVSRYLGPWIPQEQQVWQDPVPAVDHAAGRR